MKKVIAISMALVLTLILSATALAAHPHFEIGLSTVNADGSLTTLYQEAGLGHEVAQHTITITANAVASYNCVDATGVIVTTLTSPLTALTASQNVQANGQVTSMFLFAAPVITCPAGTTPVLLSATYSDILLTSSLGDTFIVGLATTPVAV